MNNEQDRNRGWSCCQCRAGLKLGPTDLQYAEVEKAVYSIAFCDTKCAFANISFPNDLYIEFYRGENWYSTLLKNDPDVVVYISNLDKTIKAQSIVDSYNDANRVEV